MGPILIIGQNGQVSSYLQRALAGKYEVVVAGRDQLDLSQVDQVYAALEVLAPALIVNPAAYTAVDLAEEESELAMLINRDAVAEIGRYSQATNTPLIHFSTDYVFEGNGSRPYTEEDPAAPTGVYGSTKLAGEKALQDIDAPAIILRTSWVYSNHGKNFYKTMLMLAESRDELSVVADQVGAPTYAGSIAQACKELIQVIAEQGQIESAQRGIYHFTCQGQTSWAGFAKALFQANDVDHVKVYEIPTKDYPTPAKRPAYSVLSGEKLRNTFGISLPDWQDALSQCAAESKNSSET
ncbi:MAG: dTDP-4-dehydrorhamnose reductase [Pseudomonadota bacterium]